MTTPSGWTLDLATALKSLRLNRHFPPWRVVAAHLRAMTHSEPPWSAVSGLPATDAWLALSSARELAAPQLEGWSHSPSDSPELHAHIEAERQRLQALADLPPIPQRAVTVRLRHRQGPLASYAVTVDHFDPASTTFARYSMILADEPGVHVSEGDLELVATDRFREALQRLSTQDAALAFAVLQDHVIEVEDVVRGVIGPAWTHDGAGTCWGPDALHELGLRGPVLSACLERASLDVPDASVDDPLAVSIIIPTAGQAFGMARRRKWAAPHDDVTALRAWLTRHGSRNLVYGYAPNTGGPAHAPNT